VGIGVGGGEETVGSVEGRGGEEGGDGAGEIVHGDGANDLEFHAADVVDDLGAGLGAGVEVEASGCGGAEGVGFGVGVVRPAALAGVTEHGGCVEGAAGEAEGAGLGLGGLVAAAGGGVVVVLEDAAADGDAPGGGAEASAARDGVGAAVDGPPGVLGFVVGLGMRGDGDDAGPGVVTAVGAEGGDEGVVAVALASDLGAEIAAKDEKRGPGDVAKNPIGEVIQVVDEAARRLVGGEADHGVAGAVLREQPG
jgi:hypothetical protein